MQRLLLCLVPAVLILAVGGCQGERVRLGVSPDGDRHEWRSPIAAEQFSAPCVGLLYEIEAPVGYSMARHQPLQGFAVNARVRWNAAVRPLPAHFDELCARHNRAEITVQEFDERKAELLAVVRDVKALKPELDAALDECESAERALAPAPNDPEGSSEADPAKAAADMDRLRAGAEEIIKRAEQRVEALGG